jgi:hypothetical protein
MRLALFLAIALACGCDDEPAPAAPSAAPTASAPDARVATSRALVKRFGGELKGELMAALSAGGPVAAVTVCNDEAPRIAEQVERDAGWSIRRTSLALRNPKNAPDAWERVVLELFAQRKEAGVPIDELEKHDVVDDNGRKVFRYMKAIGTEPLCLSCHGSELTPEVKRELDRLYPDDRARGLSAGDLRGAFSLRKAL